MLSSNLLILNDIMARINLADVNYYQFPDVIFAPPTGRVIKSNHFAILMKSEIIADFNNILKI